MSRTSFGITICDFGPSRTVLIHVLDLVDEEKWRQLIKERYEALLMEIFE